VGGVCQEGENSTTIVEMNLILDGIKIGLVLAALLGPIFFALVQAGVERGLRAGAMVGLGIWISDLLFILGVYWGISYVSRVTQWEHFSLVLGVGGSIVLIFFGIGALISKAPIVDAAAMSPVQGASWWSLWLKGFLINTINPFTVFFWLGLMGTAVIDGGLNGTDAYLFFGSILGTIMITDFTKVALAKKIRRRLRPVHVLWLRRISGAALVVFGIALLARALAV
jgi:threonine/homoserine/homoserine lactone efflux protein